MKQSPTVHDHINRLQSEQDDLRAEWDRIDNIPQLHWKKNKIEKRLKTIQHFINMYRASL